MSSTEKYFKFFKNFTRDYSKLVLSSFYKGSLIKDLITEYINIRYYNLYEQKYKNTSKNIPYIASKIANILNVSVEEVSKRTLENTSNVFDLI